MEYCNTLENSTSKNQPVPSSVIQRAKHFYCNDWLSVLLNVFVSKNCIIEDLIWGGSMSNMKVTVSKGLQSIKLGMTLLFNIFK